MRIDLSKVSHWKFVTVYKLCKYGTPVVTPTWKAGVIDMNVTFDKWTYARAVIRPVMDVSTGQGKQLAREYRARTRIM